jgi:hypothetical protein
LTVLGGIGPYRWKKLSALPKGLKLSSAGVLSGKPTLKAAPGTYSINVQVIDATPKHHLESRATLSLTLL